MEEEEYNPFENHGCHCVPANEGYADYYRMYDALSYVLEKNNLESMQRLLDHYSGCGLDIFDSGTYLDKTIKNNQIDISLIIIRATKRNLPIYDNNTIVKIMELGFSLDVFYPHYDSTHEVRQQRDLFHETIRQQTLLLPNVLLDLVANYSIF